MNNTTITDNKLQPYVYNFLVEEADYSAEARAACEIFDSIMHDGEFTDDNSKDLIILFLEKSRYNASEADQPFQVRKIDHLIARVQAGPVRDDARN